MERHRFDVFGTLVDITGTGGGTGSAWQAFYPGADGKRRAADFVVPAELGEHELADYLADLFHENATPRKDKVSRLP